MSLATQDTGAVAPIEPRHTWTRDEVEALFALPFNDLIFQAQSVHRQWFDANPALDKDNELFDRLGLKPMAAHSCPSAV